MRRRIVPLLLAALIALVASPRVGAQEATPVATPAATPPAGPDAPAAAECRIAPRSLASFQGLATPAATPAAPPVLGAAGLPTGTPADPETAAAIAAAARELIACVNAGDFLRAFALFNDAYLRSTTGPEVMSQQLYDLFATPAPRTPERQIILVAVRDPRLLPDGRAGALVTVIDPTTTTQGEMTSFLIFVRSGDRWLLDGSIEDLPSAATPTP